jgi:hypothetical protein
MYIEPDKNRRFFSIGPRFTKSDLWMFENRRSRTRIPDTYPPVPIREDLQSPGGSEGEREAMGTSLLWPSSSSSASSTDAGMGREKK